MSYITTFKKSYDLSSHSYEYYINGITCYSSEDLTEPEVLQLLNRIDSLKHYVE